MLRQIGKRSAAFLLLLLILAGCVCVSAAKGTDRPAPEAVINEILEARMRQSGCDTLQQLVSETFAASPCAGEEWIILSLRNLRDDLNYERYRIALLKKLREDPPGNVVTRQKAALAYLAVNGDAADLGTLVDDTAGQMGIMSWVFALHLLNNGAPSVSVDAEAAADAILSLRKEDGGWAITGDYGDPDVTAMAIQALSVFYSQREDVHEAVDLALDMLSEKQLENGGFASYGNENPESPAQLLLALASVGIDGLQDERFLKNGNSLLDAILSFRLSDGTYSHLAGSTFNQTSTTQVLYSLVGYERFRNGESNFYLFDDLTEPEVKETTLHTEKKGWQPGPKGWISLGIAAVALGCAGIRFGKRKRIRSCLGILLVAALIIAGVNLIRIESTDRYYGGDNVVTGEAITCTLSIRCDTVAGQADYLPADGVILDFASIRIPKGGTALDQLIAAAKQQGIHLEINDGYVTGISYLYEQAFGDLSGWMFRVNGAFASVGSSGWVLEDNDYVEWMYTTDLGHDVGNIYLGD